MNNANYAQTTEMRTDEGTQDQHRDTGSAEEMIPDDTDQNFLNGSEDDNQNDFINDNEDDQDSQNGDFYNPNARPSN